MGGRGSSSGRRSASERHNRVDVQAGQLVQGGYKSAIPATVEIGKAFNANDISRDDFKKVLDTMPDGTIYSSREHFRTYSKENGEWIVTVGSETSVGKVASKEQMADVRKSRWGVTFNIPDANKAAEWRKKYKR